MTAIVKSKERKELLFDLETDGLLSDVSVIHCGSVLNMKSGVQTSYGPTQIPELIDELKSADVLIGHNICGFDVPVLEKLHGYEGGVQQYIDTLSVSQVLYPGSRKTSILRVLDIKSMKGVGNTHVMPTEFIGRHSLKAWCHRLKLGDAGKADYDGGWESFSQEMMDYCDQDVRANAILLKHFLAKPWPVAVYYTESMMTYILTRQSKFGIGFDEDTAIELMADLTQKRADLTRELQAVFPPIQVPEGRPKQWKKNMTCRKYKEGEDGWFPPRIKGEWHQKMKTQEFNPGSTQHVAARLIERYEWEPQAFTPGGQAQVTDEILRDLPWPEAKQCADYQIVKSALSYISTGDTAWLKLVRDGRIHGRVQACGAVTHRASHSQPNLANVPKVDKAYGKECRALFVAGGGSTPLNYKLVGCDASSLQLAIYAHYVSKYDGGLLAELVEGEDADPHEYMRKASGLYYRENQKTLTYATWFGAQSYKQGQIVLLDWRMAFDAGLTDEPVPGLRQAAALGVAVNARMLNNMKGFEDMAKACSKSALRGYIVALDGRRIPVTQERLALLTLLQGNEAVVMKTAYLIAYERLNDEIKAGTAHPALWVHDEFQWVCHPTLADSVGQALSECITEAGQKLGLRLNLGAKYKVGDSWAETH
jgi:hypothetical protein